MDHSGVSVGRRMLHTVDLDSEGLWFYGSGFNSLCHVSISIEEPPLFPGV